MLGSKTLQETLEESDGHLIEKETVQQQLSAIDFISTLLTESSFDLDLLLNEIARVTAETLRAKAASIRLLDKGTGEMVLMTAYGLSREYLTKGPVVATRSVFRPLIGNGPDREDIVEVLDVSSDPSVQYAREAVKEGIRSMHAAPLVRDGRFIGALSVLSEKALHFTDEERRLFTTIANHASVAISLAQLYQEKLALQRIEHELEIAADIQRKLLPSSSPKVEGFDIAGNYRPSEEVGGDFFDFIELPENNLGVAVGDVAGKGIPAALIMATVRTALRVQAENIYAMRDVVGRVNRAVYEDTRPEEFVTLFYGVLEAKTGIITYVNAGHNTTVLVRDGSTHRLEPGGPPVGILPDLLAGEETLQLRSGDVLAVYSDGYPDSTGRKGLPFGEERVLRVLKDNRALSAAGIIDALENALKEHRRLASDFRDDRTIVVIKAV